MSIKLFIMESGQALPICCFGSLFGGQRADTPGLRRELRKRLNFQVINKAQPSNNITLGQDYTSRSTRTGYQIELQPETLTKSVTTTRAQSVARTPQPVILSRVQTRFPEPSNPISNNSRRSTHSLDAKKPLSVQSRLGVPSKCTQKAYSRTTDTSKRVQTLDMNIKVEPTVIPLPSSSLALSPTRPYKRTISLQQEAPVRILSLCKDIKSSMYQETLLRLPPITQIRLDLVRDFVKRIPSSQLPNEYAISREPSSQIIMLQQECYYRP